MTPSILEGSSEVERFIGIITSAPSMKGTTSPAHWHNYSNYLLRFKCLYISSSSTFKVSLFQDTETSIISLMTSLVRKYDLSAIVVQVVVSQDSHIPSKLLL